MAVPLTGRWLLHLLFFQEEASGSATTTITNGWAKRFPIRPSPSL